MTDDPRSDAGDSTHGHALRVLEFDRVLERVAQRAASTMARNRIRALHPTHSVDDARRELARVAATMAFATEHPEWGMPTVPDVGEALRSLAADGAVLEPTALHEIGVFLRASRFVSRALAGDAADGPELGPVRARLVADRDLEDVLARSVDAAGDVLDSASGELKRIRGRLRGAHARVVKQLEDYMQRLDARFVVADGSVTVREGRYVIPVRREGKGQVGGVIHGESQSGGTIFVEPPLALALMNQLRDLERDQDREVRRILGELSARIAPRRTEYLGALDALVDFDTLHARARTALGWRAEVPTLEPAEGATLELVAARHPLLLAEEDHESVVPYDLRLEPSERALVVSGPNTGGKTVFLKAIGVICALAQAGVVPPVGKGTRLPVFATFFADIGDEQSIARSLSTFSAHLANLQTIVSEADGASLVLVDEMGTGTDPSEGAALAQAVLEELVERGARAIVSSHLGELKRLDGEGSGVVNASMQFDPERMAPTYQFVKGRPGRSYGLAIARTSGFPAHVLDRAEALRSDEEARLEDLLGRLERREWEAERLRADLEERQARTDRLEAEVATREREVREAERTATARARADARKELMDARAEVEKAIEEVRTAGGGADELGDASRSARRRVEEAARERRDAEVEARSRPEREAAPDVSEGDRVRVRATGATGRVLEVRSGRVVVEAGALRLEVPAGDLEPVSGPEKPTDERRGGGWTGPSVDSVRTESDLRGLRVDEMEVELHRALDRAIQEDLAELRIIHGKGTGVLRQRVGQMLESDPRVRESRPGGPTEGGTGVTVAIFRA